MKRKPKGLYPETPERMELGRPNYRVELYQPNPGKKRAPKKAVVEFPIGGFEDLRVHIALVRHPDYGEYEDVYIRGSKDVFALMKGTAQQAFESMHSILIDTAGKVIGVYEVARGDVSSAQLHVRPVFAAAVVANARSIVMAHNHPSGQLKFSVEDKTVCKQLLRAGNILGIDIHDFVVVTLAGMLSLREEDRGEIWP